MAFWEKFNKHFCVGAWIKYPFKEVKAQKYYTFDDLVFTEHKYDRNGIMAKMFFPNGYGVGVVQFFGSYTNDDPNLWELAVLRGNKDDWSLTYSTDIADDVVGYLTKDQVTDYMKRIQDLKT